MLLETLFSMSDQLLKYLQSSGLLNSKQHLSKVNELFLHLNQEILSQERLIQRRIKNLEVQLQELKLTHDQELEEMRIRYELKTLNVEKEHVVSRGQLQRAVS